jgi:hypothetical protein
MLLDGKVGMLMGVCWSRDTMGVVTAADENYICENYSD